jgi:hypothetical protein
MEYQRICEHFLDPLYEFIFFTPPPCMTDNSIVVIRRIVDWYLMEHRYLYKDIWHNETTAFASLVHTQQTCALRGGISNHHTWGWGNLYWLKKTIWPPLPLYVGNYFFEKTKKAQA